MPTYDLRHNRRVDDTKPSCPPRSCGLDDGETIVPMRQLPTMVSSPLLPIVFVSSPSRFAVGIIGSPATASTPSIAELWGEPNSWMISRPPPGSVRYRDRCAAA